jgi:sec-independent protein translocase protein TatB
MFDVGFWEVALIGVVALLVVGPEKLPGLARTVGMYVGKARRYADHVRREIEREIPTREIREAIKNPKPIADLKETLAETKDSLSKTAAEFGSVGQELREDVSSVETKTSPTVENSINSENIVSEPAAVTTDTDAGPAAPPEVTSESDNKPPEPPR